MQRPNSTDSEMMNQKTFEEWLLENTLIRMYTEVNTAHRKSDTMTNIPVKRQNSRH